MLFTKYGRAFFVLFFILFITRARGDGDFVASFKVMPQPDAENRMPCRILGYSVGTAELQVFCGLYGTSGFISNREKIFSLTLDLLKDELDGERKTVGALTSITNPDGSAGLASLYRSYSYVLTWWGKDLLTGKITQVKDVKARAGQEENYEGILHSLIEAFRDFRKRNPDFVDKKFDPRIHRPVLGDVWISRDAQLYEGSSILTAKLTKLSAEELRSLRNQHETELRERRTRMVRTQQFLGAIFPAREIERFDEADFEAAEQMLNLGIDHFKNSRAIIKEITPQGHLQRVRVESEAKNYFYQNKSATVLLKWLKKEQVRIEEESVPISLP